MKRNFQIMLLRNRMDRRLFRHCLGVAQMASRIARHYGWDEEQAFTAGLFHDYAKACTPEKLLQEAGRLGVQIDGVTEKEPRLLHGPVGAALLREEFGFADPRILSSISLHTTGDRGMCRLDKLIYLADLIEEGRNYRGVARIRKLAFSHFNEALLAAVEHTMIRVIKKGRLLHSRSE